MKEEIEKTFNELTEDNKDILNMIAKGMEIAQKEKENK